MKLYQNLKLSIKALLLNKTRTIFSVIGMAVGIAAVIVTIAIGESAKQQALAPLKAMGTNVLVINAGKLTEVFGRARQVTRVTTLELPDVISVKKCAFIDKASPFQEEMLQIKYKSKSTGSLVQGVTSKYIDIRNYQLRSGQFLTEHNNLFSDRVAVLGSQMLDKLFKNEDPLGKIIYIRNIPFTVIGVLNPKGSAAELGNIDNVVMIPINTMLRRVLNIDFLSKIYLQVHDLQNMTETERFIINQLRANHKLDQTNKPNDFSIINQANAIRAAEETAGTFNYLIYGVAAISLIIGGAGILTVMILSVRERKMEIGLRISVGARKHHIVSQFLSESLLLGSLGGLSGILIGFFISYILNNFTDWTTIVSIESVLTSLIFSMSTGLVFGVLPAQRASKLNPIESLKSEN